MPKSLKETCTLPAKPAPIVRRHQNAGHPRHNNTKGVLSKKTLYSTDPLLPEHCAWTCPQGFAFQPTCILELAGPAAFAGETFTTAGRPPAPQKTGCHPSQHTRNQSSVNGLSFQGFEHGRCVVLRVRSYRERVRYYSRCARM